MAKQSSKTEIFVKIISWLALIFGALSAIGGLFNIVTLVLPMQKLYLATMTPDKAMAMAGHLRLWAFFGLCMVPLHGLAAFSGYGMLQGKAWGRDWLERLNWFFVLLCLGGLIWVLGFADFAALIPTPANPKVNTEQVMATMGVVFKVMATVGCLVAVGFSSLIIWFLRRAETRACFHE